MPGAPSVFNINTKQVTESTSPASTPGKSIINQDRVTAQKANKYSVYTIAERNLEEYKRRQDEREGIQREKPKGWARVKKHVEWKPGFHCAVCMTVCYDIYNNLLLNQYTCTNALKKIHMRRRKLQADSNPVVIVPYVNLATTSI